jgi:hypothetical protein
MERLTPLALMTVALLVVSPGLHAQGQPDRIGPGLVARGQAQAEPDAALPPLVQNADTTRQQLQNLLRQVPPNLRTVLRADPSLIDRPDYLAPYPQLVEFLQQHPEVARNPSYFFAGPSFDTQPRPLEVFAAILAGTALFFAFITVMVIIGSVARQVVDYRRWVRQSRVQAEVHTKILDRMQNNEELLAYVQTPAGRHFLEFTPLQTEGAPRAMSVPFGRILWSVQAGVVLAALGLGLRYAQGAVPEEIVPAFTVLGIIVMALGLGAVVSAGVAYFLSARFGLLPAPRQEP